MAETLPWPLFEIQQQGDEISMRQSLKKKQDRQAVMIFIVMGCISLAIFVIWYYLETSKNHFDAETLCPLNRDVEHHTVVVIDKSDEWEKEAVDRMDGFLSDIHESVPEFGRLTFIVISGKQDFYTKYKKVFDMCNPGSGEECNALFQNPKIYKKRYNESFKAPLNDIIQLLVQPERSATSPLFETLLSIIDNDQSRFIDIHMISDLMENGSKFNFYDTIPWYDTVIRAYPIETQSAVSIHAHLIERRRHSRELLNAVESVWQKYCVEQNISIDFKRMIITE